MITRIVKDAVSMPVARKLSLIATTDSFRDAFVKAGGTGLIHRQTVVRTPPGSISTPRTFHVSACGKGRIRGDHWLTDPLQYGVLRSCGTGSRRRQR